jgi:tryptophan-rich sensory protein
MKRRSAIVGASVTMAAAGLGNAFIGRDAMAWFKELRAPRWQLPMAGFLTVSAVYYLISGYVLARAVDRGDARSVGWAVAVLSANEGWNGLLFGRRSTRAAFLGLLGFLVPPGGLQRSVWHDPRSRWLLAIYTTYVIAYDLPWSYRLWRLNPPDTAR